MVESNAMQAGDEWRAGFEVELVLGTLGDPRLEDELEMHGPMDRASQHYCQIVAKRLSELTGHRWSAPRKATHRTGFFVVSEYDLDPLEWPNDRLGCVELLTPPLPISEAEAVRVKIVDAIEEMDAPSPWADE